MIVRMLRPFVVTSVVTLLGTADAGAQQVVERWEKEVAAYEATDRTTPPPRGEIVFVGSSSIRFGMSPRRFPTQGDQPRRVGVWPGFELGDLSASSIGSSFPINRGLVVYAGDNDISGGKTSEQVVVDAERLILRIRTKLPDAGSSSSA